MLWKSSKHILPNAGDFNGDESRGTKKKTQQIQASKKNYK